MNLLFLGIQKREFDNSIMKKVEHEFLLIFIWELSSL